VEVGRLAAAVSQLGFELLSLIVQDIPEHDRRPFPHEHSRLDRALPARSTADQRYFAVESSHGQALSML
jgi:hypothetical protein